MSTSDSIRRWLSLLLGNSLVWRIADSSYALKLVGIKLVVRRMSLRSIVKLKVDRPLRLCVIFKLNRVQSTLPEATPGSIWMEYPVNLKIHTSSA
uniref:Putative secreted protein n=1 Tax=Psorophora albipes TaxID=869069 RepID=T1E3D7_9DIPT